MRLIDSHAHLDFDDFHKDFETVLSRAHEAGLEKIINIGADIDRSRASIILAESIPSIFATVGVHPDEASNVNMNTIHDELITLAKSSQKVVGIGETGLDYFSPCDNKNKQQRLFGIHLDVAHHLGLPLVIHIRNGEDEEAVKTAYEMIKKFGYSKGVIHCFTFDAAWAKRFVDLGFYIGFTGIITYKNAADICDAATDIPLNKMLIETDCPFLAPQKYRGKRNEPAYVVEVAAKIAELKSLPLAKIAEQTTINVEGLFSLCKNN
jgi:TatD DNase family protein